MSCSRSKKSVAVWYYVRSKNLHEIVEDIYTRFVSLSRNLGICHIDNCSIRGLHRFKHRIHLLESGKKVLANNFISYWVNFSLHT